MSLHSHIYTVYIYILTWNSGCCYQSESDCGPPWLARFSPPLKATVSHRPSPSPRTAHHRQSSRLTPHRRPRNDSSSLHPTPPRRPNDSRRRRRTQPRRHHSGTADLLSRVLHPTADKKGKGDSLYTLQLGKETQRDGEILSPFPRKPCESGWKYGQRKSWKHQRPSIFSEQQPMGIVTAVQTSLCSIHTFVANYLFIYLLLYLFIYFTYSKK